MVLEKRPAQNLGDDIYNMIVGVVNSSSRVIGLVTITKVYAHNDYVDVSLGESTLHSILCIGNNIKVGNKGLLFAVDNNIYVVISK